MNTLPNLYAVILAGGGGTRLWPLSRQGMPKQFLDLAGNGTLLQESYSRIAPIVPAERVLVVTGHAYVEEVQRQLPALPQTNIIGEPAPRDTGPAVGVAAAYLEQIAPDATMAVLTADHLITQREKFRQVLLAAVDLAQDGHIVTLGIPAAYPETGYGYIEIGDLLRQAGGFPGQRVVRFTEKPDLETAQRFVTSGRYAWNSGMFIWRVDRIMAEYEGILPTLTRQLRQLAIGLSTRHSQEVFTAIWPHVAKAHLDDALIEHVHDIAVVPAEIGWSDVGSWAALWGVLGERSDDAGNVAQGNVLFIDSRNSLVYGSSNRLLAVIGLEDFVVVDTEDALLICPRERSQDVKRIVDTLRAQGREQYLQMTQTTS